LTLNFIGSLLILGALYWIIRSASSNFLRHLFLAGAYLLVLGLSFESFEGGIKKDPSTYSYYYVCSGLAFIALLVFESIKEQRFIRGASSFLAIQGQNPKVAYVAGSLLLLPLMTMTGLKPYWDVMHQNAWMGFAKGVVFTGIVSLITYFFVKRKWFWRT
jgi:predicted acyltransferase